MGRVCGLTFEFFYCQIRQNKCRIMQEYVGLYGIIDVGDDTYETNFFKI